MKQQGKERIFMPINDTKGQHWSLMLYEQDCLKHFDSLGSTHRSLANQINSLICKFQPGVTLNYEDCFQQSGVNCGIHVIKNIKRLRNRTSLLEAFDAIKERQIILDVMNKGKFISCFTVFIRLGVKIEVEAIFILVLFALIYFFSHFFRNQ